jgi:hypothetical protein
MCLSRNAPLANILSADGATLKLDNQKNGHKGVCVYQQTTGNPIHCSVRALGQQYQHLQENKAMNKTFICAYWMDGQAYNVTDDNISKALKRAAATLQYPLYRLILIKQFDTHSLRIGGARPLALNGFFRNAYPKNGQMERQCVQRVCAQGTSLLLRWHGKGYKAILQIFQHHRARINKHYIANCQRKLE